VDAGPRLPKRVRGDRGRPLTVETSDDTGRHLQSRPTGQARCAGEPDRAGRMRLACSRGSLGCRSGRSGDGPAPAGLGADFHLRRPRSGGARHSPPALADGVQITEYYPVPERWFVGSTMHAPGLPGRHRVDWLYSARGVSMEGDGIDAQGHRAHIADLGNAGWVSARGRATRPPRCGAAWSTGAPVWRAGGWRNRGGAVTFPLGSGGWSDGPGHPVGGYGGATLPRVPRFLCTTTAASPSTRISLRVAAGSTSPPTAPSAVAGFSPRTRVGRSSGATSTYTVRRRRHRPTPVGPSALPGCWSSHPDPESARAGAPSALGRPYRRGGGLGSQDDRIVDVTAKPHEGQRAEHPGIHIEMVQNTSTAATAGPAWTP